jgi:hypothetical protein
MRCRVPIVAVVALLFVARRVECQRALVEQSKAPLAAEHPNFSGTWELNLKMSSSSTSKTEEIEHKGNLIKRSIVSWSSNGLRKYYEELVADGQPKVKTAGKKTTTFQTAWRDRALVVEMVVVVDGKLDMRTSEEWTLSDDRKQLIRRIIGEIHGRDSVLQNQTREVLDRQ